MYAFAFILMLSRGFFCKNTRCFKNVSSKAKRDLIFTLKTCIQLIYLSAVDLFAIFAILLH